MAQRSVIRKGDRTSHGGVVVTGDESVQIFGQPMAVLPLLMLSTGSITPMEGPFA